MLDQRSVLAHPLDGKANIETDNIWIGTGVRGGSQDSRRQCCFYSLCFCFKIMKKARNSSVAKKKNIKAVDEKESTTDKAKTDSVDDETQGFGGWLRSEDGMDTMKLFVVANSIVLLTTLVFPHLKTAIEIVGEMVYGVEESYD